jgi:thiol-disulfide isomerase/thioredoxin
MYNLNSKKILFISFCIAAGLLLGLLYAGTRYFQNTFFSLLTELVLSFAAGLLLGRKKMMYRIAFFAGLIILPPVGFFLNTFFWPVWAGDVFIITAAYIAGLYFYRYKVGMAICALLLAGGVFLQSFVLLPAFLLNRYAAVEKLNNGKLIQDILPAAAKLQMADGSIFNLAGLKGKVVLFDFWFIGCAPCKQKEPSLAALAQKYAPDKVQIICINTGLNDGFRRYKNYQLDKNILSLYDSAGLFTRALGINGLPQEYIVSKDGRIVAASSGFGANSALYYEKTTIDKIEQQLKQ